MKSFGSSRTSSDRAAAGRPHGSGGSARAISSVAAAWVLCIGFDLFFHAGLIARLYLEPSPFLLPPEVAFRRIPLGYLAFLGLTLGLFWLLRRLDVKGALAGFRYGVTWRGRLSGEYSPWGSTPSVRRRRPCWPPGGSARRSSWDSRARCWGPPPLACR
jgi:hypothetical protein